MFRKGNAGDDPHLQRANQAHAVVGMQSGAVSGSTRCKCRCKMPGFSFSMASRRAATRHSRAVRRIGHASGRVCTGRFHDNNGDMAALEDAGRSLPARFRGSGRRKTFHRDRQHRCSDAVRAALLKRRLGRADIQKNGTPARNRRSRFRRRFPSPSSMPRPFFPKRGTRQHHQGFRMHHERPFETAPGAPIFCRPVHPGRNSRAKPVSRHDYSRGFSECQAQQAPNAKAGPGDGIVAGVRAGSELVSK